VRFSLFHSYVCVASEGLLASTVQHHAEKFQPCFNNAATVLLCKAATALPRCACAVLYCHVLLLLCTNSSFIIAVLAADVL
jgi:hypothetical protein